MCFAYSKTIFGKTKRFSLVQAEIEAALESVCTLVPSGMKDACKAFIESNYKMVLDFLVNEMNPKVICVQLHFCTGPVIFRL